MSYLDTLIEQVEKHLRHTELGSITAQKLLVQKERLVKARLGIETADVPDEPEAPAEPPAESKAPEAPVPQFYVGQVVEQAGKRYRVSALDANGKPSAAEEII